MARVTEVTTAAEEAAAHTDSVPFEASLDKVSDVTRSIQ